MASFPGKFSVYSVVVIYSLESQSEHRTYHSLLPRQLGGKFKNDRVTRLLLRIGILRDKYHFIRKRDIAHKNDTLIFIQKSRFICSRIVIGGGNATMSDRIIMSVGCFTSVHGDFHLV